ncbi:hypothetical protein AOLI_G00283840 [Acnodon oligacanthus]
MDLGHTGRFIKALFSTSLLFLLAHVCFQICLYTVPDLDNALGHNCSSWDTLARHIGMSRLPLDKPWTVVRLLAPDLGIFIISLITMVLCNRLVKSREEATAAHSSTLNQESCRNTEILLEGFDLLSEFEQTRRRGEPSLFLSSPWHHF